MFGIYSKSEKTDREQYLEDELERYRQAESERIDREIEQRRQRQREFEEQLAIDERSADDWHEALVKQIHLFRKEAEEERRDNDDEMFFTRGLAALERALEVWPEEAAKIQEQVDQIDAQILVLSKGREQLIDGIRLAVAERLEPEKDDEVWRSTLAGMAEVSDPNNWLYW